MRIIFMGTPDFAVPVLQSLINSRHEVVAVVTQPDRPKGRGKNMQFSPVKECALAHNIPVMQPVNVSVPEVIDELRAYEPELIVVVAFGQFVTKKIREMPKYGCINVHASLLPKYRGAGPIQWAVINGEKEAVLRQCICVVRSIRVICCLRTQSHLILRRQETACTISLA